MKTLFSILFAILLVVLIVYAISMLAIPHPFDKIIYLAIVGAFIYFCTTEPAMQISTEMRRLLLERFRRERILDVDDYVDELIIKFNLDIEYDSVEYQQVREEIKKVCILPGIL